MARSLNSNRILHSWLIAGITIIAILFLKPLFKPESAVHEILDMLALVLIAFCALGRVYTSAFLGGFKNKTLITYGPFSVVRNPLYVFSLIGITGLSITTMHPVLMIAVPIAFAVLYHFLIQREEAFLIQTFGEEYTHYMQRVPRLWPNFKNFQAPKTIESQPAFLKNAVLDAVWWFIGFWLLEMLEHFL